MKSWVLSVVLICLTTSSFAKSYKKPKRVPCPRVQPLVDSLVPVDIFIVPEHNGAGSGNHTVAFQYFDTPAEGLKIALKYMDENPVIVEVGTFDAHESCMMDPCGSTVHIHCFEPVRSLFDMVQMCTRSTPNISVYQLALGSQVGEKVLALSSFSNLFVSNESLTDNLDRSREYEIVQVTTLDEWAKECKISQADMLWLDMQGEELDVLKAAPDLIKGVSVIVTGLEFMEAYEGKPVYPEVGSWLEKQDFVLIAGNFIGNRKATQWFGAGLFVRKSLLH